MLVPTFYHGQLCRYKKALVFLDAVINSHMYRWYNIWKLIIVENQQKLRVHLLEKTLVQYASIVSTIIICIVVLGRASE